MFDSADNCTFDWSGDNAFQGLQIVAKYIDPSKKTILCSADYDMICSIAVEDAIEAGMTKKDYEALIQLNWILVHGCLVCYV